MLFSSAVCDGDVRDDPGVALGERIDDLGVAGAVLELVPICFCCNSTSTEAGHCDFHLRSISWVGMSLGESPESLQHGSAMLMALLPSNNIHIKFRKKILLCTSLHEI